MALNQLILIVPVGPDETPSKLPEWMSLVMSHADLHILFSLSPSHPCINEFKTAANSQVTVLEAPRPGRAQQLNFALENTGTKWTYFLIVHYDCFVTPEHLKRSKIVFRDPESIYHFQLVFAESETLKLLKFNEWGAYVRSSWLKLPFGDQGFLFSRTVLDLVGKFPENVPYGEDHCWIWRAHLKGIGVKSIRYRLRTSGRKYLDNGWLKTTASHVRRTAIQAAPFIRSMWIR